MFTYYVIRANESGDTVYKGPNTYNWIRNLAHETPTLYSSVTAAKRVATQMKNSHHWISDIEIVEVTLSTGRIVC